MLNKFTPAVIETLYFFLKNSVLDANLKESQMYLGLLKESYSLDKNLFKNSLSEIQKKDLQNLEKQVKEKKFTLVFEPVPKNNSYLSTAIINNKSSEKEIHDLVYKSMENLYKSLDIKDPLVFGSEIETDSGFIDLVILDQKTKIIYVIELKREAIDHKVLGQVRKYEYYYLKRLIYKLWDQVQPVTIGSKYTELILLDLKKHNVIALLYQKTLAGNLKFTKI